jgi:N-acetylmuramoyl-L-alanine amidase
VGPTGYVEADGVLKIALLLEAELKKTGAFKVQMTRRTDKYLTLTARGKMAVKNKSDLFISEHTNASNGKASGAEAFYSVDLPNDKVFAAKLSTAVAQALGIPDRGAKTRPSPANPREDYYTVIDTAQDGGVPHVLLVESAFHDNPKDEKLLKDDEMLAKIAKAQAGVICEQFGVAAGSK